VIALAVIALFMVGCTTRISINRMGHAVVEHEPTEGAVHPYPGLSPLQNVPGPFVVVFFTAAADLEGIATQHTHHLYFHVVPCSQASLGHYLVAGSVFAATADEQSRVLGSSHASEQSLYKVHIPLDLKTIAERASGQGALDIPRYLQVAKNDGLCIQLGGGQMWGAALVSNLVPAPLVIRDESLQLIDNDGA
jgi:hypothetical protein